MSRMKSVGTAGVAAEESGALAEAEGSAFMNRGACGGAGAGGKRARMGSEGVGGRTGRTEDGNRAYAQS